MGKNTNYQSLANDIKTWGKALGFQDVKITDTNLSEASEQLKAWLAKGYHGNMQYMTDNLDKRTNPEVLVPGTLRIISVRMDYLSEHPRFIATLKNKNKAYISRYALGRDYHKLIRKRLQKLADKINEAIGDFQYRAFADSAPVLEKPIAVKGLFRN